MKMQFSLALFLLLSFFQTPVIASPVGYKVGNSAPEFTLKDLKGKPYSLTGLRTKGHVLAVFWAVDCVYCYAHIKAFNQAHDEFKDKLTIAAINVGGEYPVEVSEYVTDNQLKYLVLSERLNNLDVGEDYHVLGTPTIVLISPQGHILYYGHRMPNLKKWLE